MNEDVRIKSLFEAICEDYEGELSAKIEQGKLIVEVIEAAKI